MPWATRWWSACTTTTSADDVVAEWYAEPLARGIYRSVPYSAGISTTEILARLHDLYDLHDPARAADA